MSVAVIALAVGLVIPTTHAASLALRVSGNHQAIMNYVNLLESHGIYAELSLI